MEKEPLFIVNLGAWAWPHKGRFEGIEHGRAQLSPMTGSSD